MAQTMPRPLAMDRDATGALTAETIEALRAAFAANPAHRVAQNAVTQVTLEDVALNRGVVMATDHSFSVRLDEWRVTDQKQTGRCWMFAGMNLLRAGTRRKLGLKEFEFSQNYPMFWDKVERANYFFEAIIETADRDVADRHVAWLLDQPLRDAGQWNMFVSLVRKHGLVPKALMPETESSSNTNRMNAILRSQLREGAKRLRDLHAAGASLGTLRDLKQEYLTAVHRILSIHLGTPPERFVWQWRDTAGGFHRTGELTPRQFAAEFVELPLDNYVALVHDPRPTSPCGRTFTVEYLGSIVGGERVTYLNVDMALMKGIAQRLLERGEPVWFGCDTGKQARRELGIWDRDLYDYGALYGLDFGLDKASRLQYGETQMTHAMLFTGVDVVDGRPRRWRVENSHGEKWGQQGFGTMNDSWFDEYVFEIAAPKDLLPPDLQAALDQEPIVLPAWDPMGALASAEC